MASTRDMTAGSPLRLILVFALPIAAGNLLQQLYNIVDALVIGRGEGVAALAAVSGSGWLDWTVLSVIMGFAQGFGIQIAQAFGAGDLAQVRRAAGQSILLSVLLVLMIGTFSQVFLSPILRLLQFPAATLTLTETYLRIVFGAIPVIMGMNLLSGFLYGVGDSRTPLLALVGSTSLNILLDYTLVIVLRLSVTGAALATVISQVVSCLICLLAVCRLPIFRLTRQDLKPEKEMLVRLLRLGTPIAMQNFIISVGGLVLQRVVNGFGFIFMAGYNAAARLQGMLELFGTAIGNAMGTFAGQNFGAGNLKRVRQGLRQSALLTVCIALLLTLTMFLFGHSLLSLFVQDAPEIVEQVLVYAVRFLRVMSSGLFFLYLLFVYRSTLQGLGDTLIPMVSGMVEMAMRILCALLLPALIGEWGVYFAEIAAWIGAAILLIFGYYRRIHLLEKAEARKLANVQS